jgi:hypothetical protein
MTYKVTYSSPYNFSVKSSQPISSKVTLRTKIEIMPQNLDELADVEISGTNDKYVLMYDAPSGKWKDVNPDAVLSASSNTETTSPGLPGDFVNTLDVDLDNKIDLDAGTF